MGKKYTLEDGMELFRAQLPNVANAFGVLRDQATKNGVLIAGTKRLMMIAVSLAQRTGISILMAGCPAIAYTSTVVLEVLDEIAV